MGRDLREKVKISVDLERLSLSLSLSGKRYISVRNMAELLGTSTKSAGKILSKLEARGYVERYSRRTYRLRRCP